MNPKSLFFSHDQPTHDLAKVNPKAVGHANPQLSVHEGIPALHAEVRYCVTDTDSIRYTGDNEREAWVTFDHLVRCNHEVEIFYQGMRVRSSNDGEC